MTTKIVQGKSGREYTCRQIVARYPDECPHCHGNVAGQLVWWAQGLQPFHVECPAEPRPMPQWPSASRPAASRPAAAPTRPQVQTNRKAGHCSSCGHLVPVGQGRLWHCAGSSSSCWEHWDSEDGAWHVAHLDEAKCETLRAEAEKARAEKATVAAEKQDLRRELIAAITAGELPSRDECPVVEGERLASTFDVYGGGDMFVVGETYIWYVRNNGMDGDDWSRNNAAMAEGYGPSVIAWRVAYSDELAAKVRRLDEITRK